MICFHTRTAQQVWLLVTHDRWTIRPNAEPCCINICTLFSEMHYRLYVVLH